MSYKYRCSNCEEEQTLDDGKFPENVVLVISEHCEGCTVTSEITVLLCYDESGNLIEGEK